MNYSGEISSMVRIERERARHIKGIEMLVMESDYIVNSPTQGLDIVHIILEYTSEEVTDQKHFKIAYRALRNRFINIEKKLNLAHNLRENSVHIPEQLLGYNPAAIARDSNKFAWDEVMKINNEPLTEAEIRAL